MKRYQRSMNGMRPDSEGVWCEYAEAQAEIERLRAVLREWLYSSCQPIASATLYRTKEVLSDG